MRCPTCGREEPRVVHLAGGLRVDLARETVHRADGSEVWLTERQWETFRILVEAGGRPVSRREIDRKLVVVPEASRIYILQVRERMGEQAIETVPGRGYRAAIVQD